MTTRRVEIELDGWTQANTVRDAFVVQNTTERPIAAAYSDVEPAADAAHHVVPPHGVLHSGMGYGIVWVRAIDGAVGQSVTVSE